MDTEDFHAESNGKTVTNNPSETTDSEVKHSEIKSFENSYDEKKIVPCRDLPPSIHSVHSEEKVGNFVETKEFAEGKLQLLSSKDSAECYSPASHSKKKHRRRKRSSDLNACSSNSSYTDSVGLRRRRKSSRNPVLITLSSDSGSESDPRRQSNSENEEIKPFLDIENNKGKRFAHIKADFIRKLSAIRWSRNRSKKASDNNSDSSSSNNSIIAKVKKKAKRRTVVSKVALARKRYFAQKNIRHSKCLAARNKLRRPFLRGRAHQRKTNLAIKRKRLGQLEGIVVQKRRVGRPPRLPQGQSNLLQTNLPVKKPKGRPRKYFPDMPMHAVEPASKGCSEGVVGEEKLEGKRCSSDESPKKPIVNTENSEKKAVSEKVIPANTPTILVKKRGRPKLSMNMRMVKVKTTHINRKIKPFLQNTSCSDVPKLLPRLPKCRECRLATYNKGKKNQNSYCRFLEYRKLCYARNGAILTAGFSLATDCTEDDMRMWLPRPDHPPDDLTIETSKALLVQVGDQFCDLIEQEKEALSLHIGTEKTITWKRIVQGVREMCDVCDTTLFNIHWVCPKCGLAVCIDCYKVRKQGIAVENEECLMKGRDDYLWLLCNARQPHEQEKLIMTQIVPGNALWTMQDAMHRARDAWKISSYCKCKPQQNSAEKTKHVPTGICNQLMSSVSKSFVSNPMLQPQQNFENQYNQEEQSPRLDAEINDNALNWLMNDKEIMNTYDEKIDQNHSSDEMCYNPSYESFTSLKNMLLQGNQEQNTQLAPSTYLSFSLDDIIDCVIETKVEKTKTKSEKDTIKLFNHRYPQPNSGRDPLPIRIFTTTESSIIYTDVPHSWLCNGRLLLLHQPQHSKNLELFQEQWKRGQPIMVMGVDKRLDMSLWHPDGFCRDFGEIKNDLVNCKTGAIIPNLPMKKFWEGFENFEKRMKDDLGEYMLLKLKDWPPGEDFSEKLPKRFQDLMKGLPLPEYTHRDGIFNLAGRLPSWFVRPDLGPKMYNAYGSALYPTKGTTNLHLDVSDAVNVMVYVGIPHDGKAEDHIEEALKAIDEGGCDSLMRERVRSRGVRPGALWHIYNARDADKIRDMLTKIAIERGEKLEAQHDPIHDQNWYIDAELRKRLYHEYGVEGYAIAQCLGDAVFIPAGAPHQVRNLHSCVKVAEDFVSPENIGHCFKLTQEFRHLSDTHTNHEDKLQIKNIIYHVVKDALSHLLDAEAAKLYHLSELDL